MKKNNITENMEKFVLRVSEGVGKIIAGINVAASSEALRTFVEFLRNIPDDVKNTQFFEKVQELKNVNLHYEDVLWLFDGFGLSYTEETWQGLLISEKKISDLYQYIVKIILCPSIEKREKLIILLVHMESLIYETLEISKKPKDRLKPVVKKISVEDNEGMSAESLGKIYVLAITYIVFANTDSYTDEIDKRIPFRNNILHNGIVAYRDEDVDAAYEMLVDMIEILSHVKE